MSDDITDAVRQSVAQLRGGGVEYVNDEQDHYGELYRDFERHGAGHLFVRYMDLLRSEGPDAAGKIVEQHNADVRAGKTAPHEAPVSDELEPVLSSPAHRERRTDLAPDELARLANLMRSGVDISREINSLAHDRAVRDTPLAARIGKSIGQLRDRDAESLADVRLAIRGRS